MNRQESHRIYLQSFSPGSASQSKHETSDFAAATVLHRNDSHDIHPHTPNYSTITHGAPYQFDSSPDSSQSLNSFLSLSINAPTRILTPAHARHVIQATHNTCTANRHGFSRFLGYPSTVTTSAVVRLTEKARAKDVTALLRGKFGLPPISKNKKNNSGNHHHPERLSSYYSTQTEKSKIPTRLSQVHKDSGIRYSHPRGVASNTLNALEKPQEEDEIDALVLIGTIDSPPKGYLRFEHQEFVEEQQRLQVFSHCHSYRVRHQETLSDPVRAMENSEDTSLIAVTDFSHFPVSESTVTVRDTLKTSCGGKLKDIEAEKRGQNKEIQFSDHGVPALSSSRGKLATLISELSATPCPAASHLKPKVSMPRAPLPWSPRNSTNPHYDDVLEPIHIVRTVLPDEHPLHVCDVMMSRLSHLRQKAEEEMELYLKEEGGRDCQPQFPQPTFRWYFQPCSLLGGIGSSAHSPKIQSIPAYVNIEGYCTEDESESDHDNEDNINLDYGDSEVFSSVSAGERNQSNHIVSSYISQLVEERRRIALIRDLEGPSFIASGYLMKQSWRDPNVWRRVYCVLSEDRMWTIGRMKPLKKRSDSDGMHLSLRVGRHKYIKLHRCLLLGRGKGCVEPMKQYSLSKYSGYHHTQLGHRLPHTFQMLTSQGKCHAFRAFNSQSFRVWVTSLSEKLARKHGDGMMDLANVIAEEETLARSRRIDDIAVTPHEIHNRNSTSWSNPISMGIIRFGMDVAAFQELCRRVRDTMQQSKNHGHVVNVQTRVGGVHSRRQPTFPPRGQVGKIAEYFGMVSAVWEDARMVASKSAQLIHALATLEHDKFNKQGYYMMTDSRQNLISFNGKTMMEDLIKEQKGVQAILGKYWGHQKDLDDCASGRFPQLPPLQLFTPLLEKLQKALKN